MRLTSLLLLLLLIPVPALAGGNVSPTASAQNLLRYRPGPWRPPVATTSAAIRFEPESGDASENAALPARAASTASLRRDAAATARTNADGSRHAVLGAAFRSWTVVHLDAEGRLVTECVDNAEAAARRVEAAAKRVPR